MTEIDWKEHGDISNAIAKCNPKISLINQMVRELVSGYLALSNVSNPLILDLGSGNGDLALLLSELKPNLKVLATDYSVPMLTTMDHRFEDNDLVTVVEVNLEEDKCLQPGNLSIPSQAKVITSVFTASYLRQSKLQNYFREIYENLEPGGMFVLVDELPSYKSDLNSIIRKINEVSLIGKTYPTSLGFKGELTLYPIEFIQDLLETVGFKQYDYFYKNLRTTGIYCVK